MLQELFCSREFRCWCNATMLSCYMTSCQPLTARTDHLYPIVYYLNFYTPLGTYLPYGAVICSKTIARVHSGHLNECGPARGVCQLLECTFRSAFSWRGTHTGCTDCV